MEWLQTNKFYCKGPTILVGLGRTLNLLRYLSVDDDEIQD